MLVHVSGDSDFALNTTGQDAGALRSAKAEELRAALASPDSGSLRGLLHKPALSVTAWQNPLPPLASAVADVSANWPGEPIRLVLAHTWDFGDLVALLRDALQKVPDLFGPRIEDVTTVPAGFDDMCARVSEILGTQTPIGIAAHTVGTGSINLVYASISGLFAAKPQEVFLVDSVRRGSVLPLRVEEALDLWLARRHMWGELRSLDPDAEVPQPLPDQALRAEFLDEVAKRSMKATLMARAWLVDEYQQMGGRKLTGRVGEQIEQLRKESPSQRTEADEWLIGMSYLNGAVTPKGNKPHQAKPLPLSAALRLRDQEVLLQQAGRLPTHDFPAAPTPHLLVARCVGRREQGDQDALPFVEAQHHARQELLQRWFPREDAAPPERWTWHAVLISTPQTGILAGKAGERLETLGWKVHHVESDDSAADLRLRLVDALGSHISGIDAAQRVAFLAGPGTHQMNREGLLGMNDIAQMAGVPMVLGGIKEASPGAGESSVTLNSPAPPLMGWDDQLRGIAVHQLDTLNCMLAHDTLRAGSASLAPLADRALQLHKRILEDVPGMREPDADRRMRAAERIQVIRCRLADRDPDTAAMLAWIVIEKCRLKQLRSNLHPIRRLNEARNQSYLSHGSATLSPHATRRLLDDAMHALGGAPAANSMIKDLDDLRRDLGV